MRRLPICATAVIGLSLAIMGCGGSGNSNGDASPDAPVAEAGHPEDAGHDARHHDAGSDSAQEAGPGDAATDAPADASAEGGDSGGDASKSEAGTEAGPDASADVVVDVVVDAPIDGGPPPPPDATSVCTPPLGFGYSGGSSDGGPTSCGTGEDYSCGAHAYEILCECPSSKCTCSRDKVTVGVVGFAGCPTCSSPNFASIATSCGIPH